MNARFALLGATAISAAAAGIFLYARGADESWYGFSLGRPVEQVPNVRITPATLMYPELDPVDSPPSPWTRIFLSVGRTTRLITAIEFEDLGADFVECVAPPAPRNRG